MSDYVLIPVYLENLTCPSSLNDFNSWLTVTLSNITPVLTLSDVNDNVSDISDNLAFFCLSYIIIITVMVTS